MKSIYLPSVVSGFNPVIFLATSTGSTFARLQQKQFNEYIRPHNSTRFILVWWEYWTLIYTSNDSLKFTPYIFWIYVINLGKVFHFPSPLASAYRFAQELRSDQTRYVHITKDLSLLKYKILCPFLSVTVHFSTTEDLTCSNYPSWDIN